MSTNYCFPAANGIVEQRVTMETIVDRFLRTSLLQPLLRDTRDSSHTRKNQICLKFLIYLLVFLSLNLRGQGI